MLIRLFRRLRRRFEGWLLSYARRRLRSVPYVDFMQNNLGWRDKLIFDYLLAAYFIELGEIESLRERIDGWLRYAIRLKKCGVRELILMEHEEGSLFEETKGFSPFEFVALLSKELGFRLPSDVSVAEVIGYVLFLRKKYESTRGGQQVSE